MQLYKSVRLQPRLIILGHLPISVEKTPDSDGVILTIQPFHSYVVCWPDVGGRPQTNSLLAAYASGTDNCSFV